MRRRVQVCGLAFLAIVSGPELARATGEWECKATDKNLTLFIQGSHAGKFVALPGLNKVEIEAMDPRIREALTGWTGHAAIAGHWQEGKEWKMLFEIGELGSLTFWTRRTSKDQGHEYPFEGTYKLMISGAGSRSRAVELGGRIKCGSTDY